MTDEEITESIKDDPMMQVDRRGKPRDPEFVEFLYHKYRLDKQSEKVEKRIRRPKQKKA